MPSVLSDAGYSRLFGTLDLGTRPAALAYEAKTAMVKQAAAAPVAEVRRFGSVAEVETGFRRVASGCYVERASKTAHSIWELRAAEDGAGYVLVRQREERAVDLRQAGASGPAGAGTSAAVASGIIRQASHRRVAEPVFLVSLLQTPGGDLSARKVIFANEVMGVADLERLVAELQLGPATLVHDTWSDGEWELRVRGPKGQLIHAYDSVGPEEIGGAKGQVLLDVLHGLIPGSVAEDGGLGDGAVGGGALPGEGDVSQGEAMPPAPMPEAGAPPPEAPMSAVAPSAAQLQRGARVLAVKQGQVAEAVIMLVNPQQKAVEVMFGNDGAPEEVPMHDVLEVLPPLDAVDACTGADAGDAGDLDVIIEDAPTWHMASTRRGR